MSNQMRDPLDVSIIQALRDDLKEERKRVEMLTVALERIRDYASSSYFQKQSITLQERMDAVRQIAKEVE